MQSIKPGKYRHYKGHLYEVIGVGRHSDKHTQEFVVYRGLYKSKEFGDYPLWVRPVKVFTQKVLVEGKRVPRFRYVGKSTTHV